MTRLSQLQGPHTYTFVVDAESTAGTEETTTAWVAPFDLEITSAQLVPDAAITANGTNFVTYAVEAGGTSVATRAWSATNSVANTAESMTLASTPHADAGDVITVVRTADGTGLATPRMVLVLTVQVR